MDKVVDHLLVFQGDGQVKDFPGNYTQFREWERLQPRPAKASEVEAAANRAANSKPRLRDERRLTYKERLEMERLTTEIEVLEQERSSIISALSGSTLSVEEITAKSRRLPLLQDELDQKEMRWLELSELA